MSGVLTRVTSYNKSIYFYGVISNPDVFCRREKSVKAQGGVITDFSPKKQARNDNFAAPGIMQISEIFIPAGLNPRTPK